MDVYELSNTVYWMRATRKVTRDLQLAKHGVQIDILDLCKHVHATCSCSRHRGSKLPGSQACFDMSR